MGYRLRLRLRYYLLFLDSKDWYFMIVNDFGCWHLYSLKIMKVHNYNPSYFAKLQSFLLNYRIGKTILNNHNLSPYKWFIVSNLLMPIKIKSKAG